MTQQVSTPDIIRYIYKETSPEENEIIEKAIFDGKDSTAEAFFEIIDTLNALDKLKRQPSQRCIDNILAYAKSYCPRNV